MAQECVISIFTQLLICWSVGSMCSVGRLEAEAVGPGPGLQFGQGHEGEERGPGQRCCKVPWAQAGAAGDEHGRWPQWLGHSKSDIESHIHF